MERPNAPKLQHFCTTSVVHFISPQHRRQNLSFGLKSIVAFRHINTYKSLMHIRQLPEGYKLFPQLVCGKAISGYFKFCTTRCRASSQHQSRTLIWRRWWCNGNSRNHGRDCIQWGSGRVQVWLHRLHWGQWREKPSWSEIHAPWDKHPLPPPPPAASQHHSAHWHVQRYCSAGAQA